MQTVLIRLAAIAILTLPLGACFFYSDTTPRPAPVVVQQPPPSGSVVVQPQP